MHGGAFGILGADIQQAHPGILDAQGLLRAERAHAAKLQQELRRALGIGAAVDDDTFARLGGHGGAEGRPADAPDAAYKQRGRR